MLLHESEFGTVHLAETSTLVVRGCVDEHQIEALRSALLTASDDFTQDLTVDLSDVEFLPSLAIAILVGARKACAPSSLRLVARQGTIARRVLDICGLPVDEPEVGEAPLVG